jgi:hypothetical protein
LVQKWILVPVRVTETVCLIVQKWFSALWILRGTVCVWLWCGLYPSLQPFCVFFEGCGCRFRDFFSKIAVPQIPPKNIFCWSEILSADLLSLSRVSCCGFDAVVSEAPFLAQTKPFVQFSESCCSSFG